MPRFSVFLPTHDHASTLPYAVRSVQNQRVDDLEILICGDGATAEVKAVVADLMRGDERIRFFDLPKAPARGELNRDYVMRQAKGSLLFHQNDDDLWLPGHMATLESALEGVDFVGAIQTNVGTDGRVRAYYFDLERPEFVLPWLEWIPNEFGEWACNGFHPIFVAHRVDAFLRLPEGWVTTAPGLPADQAMWHRFLRQPWCRAKFLRWPIALHFPAPDREDWSPDRRGEELRHWTEIIEAPDYAVRIWRDIMPDLGDRLLRDSLQRREQRLRTEAEHEAELRQEREQRLRTEAEHEAELRQEREQRRRTEAQHDAVLRQERERRSRTEAEHEALLQREREQRTRMETEHEAVLRQEREASQAAVERERSLRQSLEAECAALRASTSWRMTAPLRFLAQRVRKLRG